MQDKQQEEVDVYGLNYDEIVADFREPYILTGYRRPYITSWQCLCSIFRTNSNETANIWTHAVPVAIYSWIFYSLFTSTELHYEDHFSWPLIANAAGICLFLIASVLAHTFNSVSLKTRHLCFSLDYVAITIYSVGAAAAIFFYAGPEERSVSFLESSRQNLLVNFLISVFTTASCCISRFKWLQFKYLIRTLSFVVPFLTANFPYLYRIAVSDQSPSEVKSLSLFLVHVLFYAMAAILNVSRFPEKYIPRKFDIVGQSHNLMHVCVAIAAFLQIQALKVEIDHRKDYLVNDRFKEERYFALPVMIVVAVTNILLAISLCCFLYVENDGMKKED